MRRDKVSQFPQFTQGERVQLVRMDDKYAPPVGTKGTVTFCTDLGGWQQVGVKWDNGSTLMVAMPEDVIERI